MTKNKWNSDLETRLKSMEVIFQKPVFAMLSALVKRQSEHTSFTWLKVNLSLNPNSLSKYLKKLVELGLVDNYYEKEEGKHYSFYRITEKALNFLNLQVGIPRVWELLDKFKEYCKLKGWKISEHEDWVKTNDGKYHIFFWVQSIRPSTFEKICAHNKSAIRKGVSYRIIDVSYTAWLFPQGLSEDLMQIVEGNPKISNTTAVYDLSQAYLINPQILRFNNTASEVFREFEYFLRTQWKVKITNAESHLKENSK